MSIVEFSWINSVVGGAVIGLSVVLMMASLGKVTGISGILSNLLKPASAQGWHWAFILGLLFSGILVNTFFSPITIQVQSETPLLIVAGLLVGFGSRLANGCTSGHGVCGVARFSVRSIVATAVFMSAGMLTVYLVH